MPRTSIAIAKITPPRVSGTLPRERLFRLLDAGSKNPVIWVTAPAGSGKTTLVAQWLAARGVPHLWYLLDAGDSDQATFFHYLGQAEAKAHPRRKKPLPPLSADYLLDVPTFTRRYFEELCGRYLSGSSSSLALVFDNFHALGDGSCIPGLLLQAAASLPDGVAMIVISRNELPPEFMRLKANNRLAILGWNELRFTLAEIRETVDAARRGRCMEVACPGPENLYEKTDGWAAGLRLMLAASEPGRQTFCNSTPSAPVPHCIESLTWQEDVFSYFACEVMASAEPAIRDFLQITAQPPLLTAAVAVRLTGRKDAARILSDLSRRHLFLDWFPGPKPVYRYHPLFREFLLKTAAARFDVAEIAEIRRRAAPLLHEAGMTGEAVDLYLLAGAWDEAADLVTGEAEELIMQGRNAVLESWLLRFPENMFDERPWLLYWLGLAKLGRCPAEGRVLLERALRLFTSRRDETGMLLAWAAATESIYYAFDDYREFDGWIAWLDARKPLELAYPSPRVELSVCISMVTALVARQPYHPDLDAWVGRLRALFQQHRGEFASFHAATIFAFYHYYWRGDFFMMGVQAAEIQNMAKSGAVPPLFKVMSEYLSAEVELDCKGNPGACLLHVRSALSIAGETGVMVWDGMLLGLGAYSAILTGDLVLGEEYLTRMQSMLTPERKHAYCHYYYLAAFVAAMRAEHGRARDFMRLALQFAEETGFFFPLVMCLTRMAVLLHQDGEAGEADKLLERALVLSTSAKSDIFRYACLLEKSRIAFDRGRESDGVTLLREALHIGAQRNYFGPLWWREHTAMARLCEKALAYGIEPEYARMLIRVNRLQPGEDAPVDWPWPFCIRTLGGFEVLRDGEPLLFHGGVQKKPLEMLKALIAFGGRDVPEERIMDALWPDADGDAAHTALKATLHRLRKGLGDDGAVVLKKGRLSLSTDLCRVDALAFLTVAGRGTTPPDQERILAWYRGPFLPDDQEEPWAVPMRERIRRHFLRFLDLAATELVRAGRLVEAAARYEQAIEADELDEDLCRRLMECYQRLERPDKVAAAYERCRTALRSRLDIDPSPALQRLRQSLTAKDS